MESGIEVEAPAGIEVGGLLDDGPADVCSVLLFAGENAAGMHDGVAVIDADDERIALVDIGHREEGGSVGVAHGGCLPDRLPGGRQRESRMIATGARESFR